MDDEEERLRARWCSPPPDTIAWVSWDDEYVAYHRHSGKTHFLNAASARLISELLQQSSDAVAIAKAFAPPEGEVERRAHLAEILSMLERLEHLGLIQRA